MPSRLKALVDFSRLVSDARDPDRILPTLLESAVAHVGAEAVAVARVTEEGRIDLAAEHGLPPGPGGDPAPPIDELEGFGAALAASRGAGFGLSSTLPLVSDGELFGALILYFAPGRDLEPASAELARALVDLCAIAFQRAAKDRALRDSFEALRASKELLARSERLRALGAMAATVSHDLKNVLNPLGLQVELMRRRLAGHEGAAEVVEQIAATLRHGLSTVDRLRRFSAQEERPRGTAPAELDSLVAQALELSGAIARAEREGVELRHEAGAPAVVMVEAAEIKDAIVNLVVNALDAVGSGDRVVIRTGADGDRGWLEVSDNGPGIPAEVKERLFEPFVSTKGQSGTGLGLAMVYAAATRHGGEVRCESSDAGTSFRILLPLQPHQRHR